MEFGAVNKNYGTSFQSRRIGVFWDMENVRVPRGRSGFEMIRRLRERFYRNHLEAEFAVVVDTSKENQDVLDEINESQLDIIYTRAVAKNACDEKLKQKMWRFVTMYQHNATVLLLSGDYNFAVHLSDFRHRLGVYVIIIFSGHASESLLACANESYESSILTTNLPLRRSMKSNPVKLLVTNLPLEMTLDALKTQLKSLLSNTGGKIVNLNKNDGKATLIFSSADVADRAKMRLNNEIIGTTHIVVDYLPRDSTLEQQPSAVDTHPDDSTVNIDIPRRPSVVMSSPGETETVPPNMRLRDRNDAEGNQKMNPKGRNVPKRKLEE